MPLLDSVLQLARSRHGRRAVSHATRYARSPQGRATFDRVRRQIASRRKGATRAR